MGSISEDNNSLNQNLLIIAQYGHSQSEKKIGVGDKYHRSIKVHTEEAQNQHQLKSDFLERRIKIKSYQPF